MTIDNARWEQLQLLRTQLKRFFKQREDLVDGALVALLAKVHLLVLGPPGTAKSMLAEVVCRQISGARFFSYVLNKYTTWPQLACGPVTVIEKLEGGDKAILFRNTPGPLLESEIVFLDEIFKASGPTNNSLLPLLNEREYSINPGEKHRAPLETAFAASNEMPGKEDTLLRAFADRLLLRYEVDYITVSHEGDTAFIDMLEGRDPLPDVVLEKTDLDYFRAEAEKVIIRRGLLGFLNSLRATLRNHSIQPSDRRFKESLKVLRAHAFLNGRTAVELPDLAILQHVLWVNPDAAERETVRRVVVETSGDPALLRCYSLFGEAQQIHDAAIGCLRQARAIIPFDEPQRQQQETHLTEALAHERRLAEIHSSLRDLCNENSSNGNTSTLRTFSNEVHMFRENLVSMRGVENAFLELGA